LVNGVADGAGLEGGAVDGADGGCGAARERGVCAAVWDGGGAGVAVC